MVYEHFHGPTISVIVINLKGENYSQIFRIFSNRYLKEDLRVKTDLNLSTVLGENIDASVAC